MAGASAALLGPAAAFSRSCCTDSYGHPVAVDGGAVLRCHLKTAKDGGAPAARNRGRYDFAAVTARRTRTRVNLSRVPTSPTQQGDLPPKVIDLPFAFLHRDRVPQVEFALLVFQPVKLLQ